MSPLEPAFPVLQRADTFFGLTRREWFAGQALMGIMACRDKPSILDLSDNDLQEIAAIATDVANICLLRLEGQSK